MAPVPAGHASLIGSAFGGYEVQALIGRGATGTVYLARDVALGRPVALKVLLGSIARNPIMVRSFYREAQAAAPLRHPNIVRIYTAGIEGGTPYIAMEYVPGEPLDRFLRRKGQVSWQAALYVGMQVAEALHCAHEAGIIHRDVKPANILLDRQGRVRLTDFGIARVRADRQPGETDIAGTPQYMSPEQCAGDELTPRADLYSLGVTLFQLISGRLPFHADAPQALMRLIAMKPAPRLNRILPDVPDDVARLVAHLLEKNAEARPLSARHVCQTIERIQAEDGGRSAIPQALAAYVREQAQESPLRLITPPPREKGKTPRTEAVQTTRARRWRYSAGAAVAVTLMAAVATILWAGSDARPLQQPAPIIDGCTFESAADGTITAALPAAGFRARRLRWTAEGGTLLVEAGGTRDAMQFGATGVLAIQPDEERCNSVSAPSVNMLADGVAGTGIRPLSLSASLRQTNDGRVLLGQRGATGAGTYTALVFAQSWRDAQPALNPIATYETAWSMRPFAVTNARGIHAVLSPDGGSVCVVIEQADGQSVLAEQRVHGGSPLTEFTPPGPPIIAESVQYTPRGDRVVFLRQGDDGKQELWSTPTAPSDRAGLLAVGYFDGEISISPRGDRVAAAWAAQATDVPELRVVDAADGKILDRLGPGTVGADAWVPDGNALVAALPDENGRRQLTLVSLPTRNERLLAMLPNGIERVTAVSADGRWAAAIPSGTSGVRVVFAPLEATPITTAARRGLPQETAVGTVGAAL